MAGYSPGYQQYVDAFNIANSYVADDSGKRAVNGTPMSEAEWNKLSDDAKWQTFNGVNSAKLGDTSIYKFDSSDPRYADLLKQTGAEDGRLFIAHGQLPLDTQHWNDPSKVINLGNGDYAFAENNQTANWQHQMHPSASMPTWAALWLAAMGGMGALGVGATEAGTTAATTAGTTAGTSAAAEVPGMIAPGMESQALLENSLLNSGILPGTQEWVSAMTAAGLDPTAGASLEQQLAANSGTYEPNMYGPTSNPADAADSVSQDILNANAGDGIPDTEGLPGSGDPGADPAPGPATDSSSFLDKLTDPTTLAKLAGALPGLAGALKPLAGTPRGSTLGAGLGGGGVGGGVPGGRGVGPIALQRNPYAQGTKPDVGSLMQYLRG